MTPFRLGFLSLALVALTATGAVAQDGDIASIVSEWASSAHADASAEAFTHWNDEGEVPATCAMCHAGAGFRDFYGIDGTAVGTIDAAVPVGGVIDCDTCHKPEVAAITEVRFPSGISKPVLESSATCMTCHQGRQSGAGIAEAIAGLEEDTINADIRFMNPHYKAAAATLFGSEVTGMYEYPGQTYVTRFEHVPAAQACTACHSPHTLEVRLETCQTCHIGVEDPATIRVNRVDFDGDGTGLTGIKAEVAALTEMLGEMIGVYSAEVAGAPAVWAHSYPYFFIDTNGNGMAEEDEAVRPNAYANWTPRMLKAAYNYQFVVMDPGAYAHNSRYTLQILHDSIADLAGALGRDVSMLTRAE